MTVKSIIKLASSLLNRKDLISYLDIGKTTDEERVVQDVETLVTTYNVIAEELSTIYNYVSYTQKLTVSNGVLKYSQFTYNPVKILSVKDMNGDDVECTILPVELRTNATRIEVKYTYVPPKRKIVEESDFTNTPIKEGVIAYGVVTEYCLIKGMYEEAGLWHDKYLNGLNQALSNGKSKKLKGRVWW